MTRTTVADTDPPKQARPDEREPSQPPSPCDAHYPLHEAASRLEFVSGQRGRNSAPTNAQHGGDEASTRAVGSTAAVHVSALGKSYTVSHYTWPRADDLLHHLTAALAAHADAAIASGDRYIARLSWNLPDEALLDWPARSDLVTRHRWAISQATADWWPVDHDEFEIAFYDASATLAWLDISPVGRPHFYAWAVLPNTITTAMLVGRLVGWTGADRRSVKVDRLWRWDKAVDAHEMMMTSDYVSEGGAAFAAYWRQLLGYDIEAVTSYGHKGSDRGRLDRRMPATLPAAFRLRPANDFIVYSRGVSITTHEGVAMDLIACVHDARRLSPAKQQILAAACEIERQRRNRRCSACGRPLPPVRSSKWDTGDAKPLWRPRVDRDHCDAACRVRAVRQRTRPVRGRDAILATLGRLWRAGRITFS